MDNQTQPIFYWNIEKGSTTIESNQVILLDKFNYLLYNNIICRIRRYERTKWVEYTIMLIVEVSCAYVK